MSTYPEEFKTLKKKLFLHLEENKRLRKALEIAQEQFANPIYGCNWQDAADDIEQVLQK